MTRFHKADDRILKVKRLRVPSRQISAVALLLALLMPTAAPIPAWASPLQACRRVAAALPDVPGCIAVPPQSDIGLAVAIEIARQRLVCAISVLAIYDIA